MAADPDDLDEPPFPWPHKDYEGIPNAWGQYGVMQVGADTAEPDAEPCIFMDTTMCETTLSIDGARELIRRLRGAIKLARRGEEGIVPPRRTE